MKHSVVLFKLIEDFSEPVPHSGVSHKRPLDRSTDNIGAIVPVCVFIALNVVIHKVFGPRLLDGWEESLEDLEAYWICELFHFE